MIAVNKTRPAFLKEGMTESEHHKFYFINDYAEVYAATDLIRLYLSEHAKMLVESSAVDKIAEIRGITAEEVEAVTRENAYRLFTKVGKF